MLAKPMEIFFLPATSYCKGKDLVYLAIIALVEAFWHSEDDPGSPVIADQHLTVREGDSLDLSLQSDVVQRSLQQDRPGGFRYIHLTTIDVIRLAEVGGSVIRSQVEPAIPISNALNPLWWGLEVELAEVFAGLQIVPV